MQDMDMVMDMDMAMDMILMDMVVMFILDTPSMPHGEDHQLSSQLIH